MEDYGNSNSGQRTFIEVAPTKGQPVLKIKVDQTWEGKPGYVKREYEKDGQKQVSHQVRMESFVGYIVGIKKNVNRLQPSVDLMMDSVNPDGATFPKVQIQMEMQNWQTNGFLRRMPNIDLAQPVKVAAYFLRDENSDQDHYNLRIVPYQKEDGEWVLVQPKWTREDPGAMPLFEKNTNPMTHKTEWNGLKQLEWLFQYTEALIQKHQDNA